MASTHVWEEKKESLDWGGRETRNSGFSIRNSKKSESKTTTEEEERGGGGPVHSLVYKDASVFVKGGEVKQSRDGREKKRGGRVARGGLTAAWLERRRGRCQSR